MAILKTTICEGNVVNSLEETVCKLQNYWVSGICPMPGTLNTTKHNFSENEHISVLK
jgi:hypothetical protein